MVLISQMWISVYDISLILNHQTILLHDDFHGQYTDISKQYSDVVGRVS